MRKIPLSEKIIDSNGLSIRCMVWGEPDAPPVLALHGLASSANWYDLIAPDLARDFKVIAPDQRGHGKTTQATEGYDWKTLAIDMVQLLDVLDISTIGVLGHSWGATVAAGLAYLHPERISSLTMIDGGFGRIGSSEISDWETVKQNTFPRDVSGTRSELLCRMSEQLACCWNADIERIVQTMVWEDDCGQMHDILHPDNHIQVMKAMWEEPASSMWPNIKCPTLLVPAGPLPMKRHLERFWNKQSRVAVASSTISNCKVHWIQNTIHDIGYHRPEYLSNVIRAFLNNNL